MKSTCEIDTSSNHDHGGRIGYCSKDPACRNEENEKIYQSSGTEKEFSTVLIQQCNWIVEINRK